MLKSVKIILISALDSSLLLTKNKKGQWEFPDVEIEKHESEKGFIVCKFKGKKIEPNIIFNKVINQRGRSFVNEKGKYFKKNIYFVGIICDTNLAVSLEELTNVRWFTVEEVSELKELGSNKLLNKIRNLLNFNDFKICVNCTPKNKFRKKSIQGSKHLYSRIAPIALLNPKIKFINIPKIIDAAVINKIISLNTKVADDLFIPKEICKLSRSIIAMIPAILYKHKTVTFFPPRGCNIGERKIDFYLEIIKKFGGKITKKNNLITISKNTLRGTDIALGFPSFTGTSTALLMASIIKKKSIISNISIEPEILGMIGVLQKIGVKIKFISERVVEVMGGKIKERKCLIYLNEDRNVLVTRIMAALIREKPFHYYSKHPLYLSPLVEVLERMGVNFSYTKNSFRLGKNYLNKLKPVEIVAGHFPLFCSDWQPLIAPILCKLHGISIIKDSVFEKRYEYIKEIQKINTQFNFKLKNGSLIICGGKSSRIRESDRIKVRCLDIRSGAANIIAALGENKKIEIYNIRQILRGYENIIGDLGNTYTNPATYEI
jgi:UDP-N-acetylglucosamine 1-carboxyvinyltransferase